MAIVFDLGGVVFRWQPVQLLQSALPRFVDDAPAAADLTARWFESHRAGSDWSEFDRGAIDEDTLTPRLAERTGLSAAEVRAVLAAIPTHLTLQADTMVLAQRLKAAGERLFFLSNMPEPMIAQVHPRLVALDLFEDGLYSAEVRSIKPEPAIFHLALERFGLAPGDCLFLDDSPANVTAARALGWSAWLFSDAAMATDDLCRALGRPLA